MRPSGSSVSRPSLSSPGWLPGQLRRSTKACGVDSNQLFIDDLRIPVEDRIGEEGHGFEYILHGMNPERVLIAGEAVGLGRAALQVAVKYAREHANELVVTDRQAGDALLGYILGQ